MKRILPDLQTIAWAPMLRRGLQLVVNILPVLIVIGWFFFLRPRSLGGPASYVMVSGSSMEPTLDGGDLVFLQQADDYQVGDVVAFQVENAFVIHRIRAETAQGYVMQGDNNDHQDRWRPQDAEILGRMLVHLPDAGLWISLFKSPLVLGTIAGWLAIFFVLSPNDLPFLQPKTVSQNTAHQRRLSPWGGVLLKKPLPEGASLVLNFEGPVASWQIEQRRTAHQDARRIEDSR